MKNYTERRIELGQDLNNAWALVAAFISSDYPVTNDEVQGEFDRLYRIVRGESERMRKEREAEWAEEDEVKRD